MIRTLNSTPAILPGDVDAPAFRPNPAHARKEIAASVLADAQHLFETTDIPLSEIARRVGLHRSLLHRTVLRKGWSRPEPAARQERVAQRLRARIEKELCSVEISLAHSRSKEAREAAKQSVDTLSSLMRTLRELRRYDLEDEPRVERYEPVDIDEIRGRLADQLIQLRHSRIDRERAEAEA